MTLNLPQYEQVMFDESPLEKVVCQLRFHQILKINASPPAEFQDLIRDQFPVFGQERGIQFSLAGSQPVVATNEPSWQFKSTDENWVVSLTNQFLALTSVAYDDFNGFLSNLKPVIKAFETVYSPPFYTRVGLRYVNRFIRFREDGQRIPWEKLLNKRLSAAHADPVLKQGVTECNHHFLLKSDPGQIGWRYSHDIGQSEGQPAERFTIDFDHFVADKVSCGDVVERLICFNDIIYRFFRWCLTEEGYNSLGPRQEGGQE